MKLLYQWKNWACFVFRMSRIYLPWCHPQNTRLMSPNKVVLKSHDISWKDVWDAGGWGCSSFFLHFPSLPDKFQETFPSEFGLAMLINWNPFITWRNCVLYMLLKFSFLFQDEHTQLRSFYLSFKMYMCACVAPCNTVHVESRIHLLYSWVSSNSFPRVSGRELMWPGKTLPAWWNFC